MPKCKVGDWCYVRCPSADMYSIYNGSIVKIVGISTHRTEKYPLFWITDPMINHKQSDGKIVKINAWADAALFPFTPASEDDVDEMIALVGKAPKMTTTQIKAIAKRNKEKYGKNNPNK